jgi:hypothetical protein
MIVYQLACEHDHFFEGWFASSEACERQASAGQLLCPTCSSAEVRKLPSAPYVKGSTSPAQAPLSDDDAKLRRQALAALRKYLITNTDYVGRQFAEVARRMHYEEEAQRNIRGEVTGEEAHELHEEGIEAFVISGDVLPSEEIH